MSPLRRILVWIWARQQQITFVATLALVLISLVGIGSVIYAAQAFRLQSRQYEEEAFNREQGAASLAWHTIAEANLNSSEIGQSNAFRFLVLKSQLNGNVTLSGSSLSVYLGRAEQLFVNLSESNLCGSDIFLRVNEESSVNMSNSLLIGTRLAGWLMHAEFSGADLNQAQLNGVRAPSASFVATNLKRATFVGGTFESADFQGADLSGAQTYRGYQGAGTNYDQTFGGVADGYYGSADISPNRTPAVFASASDKVPGWEADDDGQAVALVDFRGARFMRADIRGADLTNSTIGQAQVDEACADQTTKLPTGVTLKKACMDESWVAERRALIQRKTYRGRSKALEVCQAQASQLNWK